jgi:hypothetical protein
MAGVLSGILPGLGQFYCRQWAKGAGFLVGTIAIDGVFGVTSDILDLLQSFGSPVPSETVWKFVLGSLLLLAVALWCILDAVRTAKKSSPNT